MDLLELVAQAHQGFEVPLQTAVLNGGLDRVSGSKEVRHPAFLGDVPPVLRFDFGEGPALVVRPGARLDPRQLVLEIPAQGFLLAQPGGVAVQDEIGDQPLLLHEGFFQGLGMMKGKEVLLGDGGHQRLHAEGVPHHDQTERTGDQDETGQDEQDAVAQRESHQWPWEREFRTAC